MSSASSNTGNPDSGGNKDGRGGGRGKDGRGRKKRNRGGAVDQSTWRALDKPYREWLVSRGIAVNAAAFNNLSTQERLSASSTYDRAAESERLTTLLRSTLLSQANPYAVISDSHYSQDDSEEVKTASMGFYGLPNKQFCQILGQQPEQVKIVNAHIWPRNGTAHLPLFGLKTEDIHNPRNVLRLHQCIERAFDRRELVFVADANGQLVVEVLSTELKTTVLKGTRLRFSDIDGAPLQINTAGALPYTRLVAHHSVLAHRWAREKGWISDDLAVDEVNAGALLEHSLDPEAQERIKLLWREQE